MARATQQERMDRYERTWRLVRDILLTVLGAAVVVVALSGTLPPNVAPGALPFAAALFAAPKWLRDDERKRQERSGDRGDSG